MNLHDVAAVANRTARFDGPLALSCWFDGLLASRMKPWRAAETSATASGKSTRMASRSAIACSSTVPVGSIAAKRRRGQVDRGVQRQRRELLALRVGNGLRLLLRELAQSAQEILRIAAEREAEAAFFHTERVTVSDQPSGIL